MRKLKITYNNPRGLIFNDRQLARRYAVNRKGILLNNTIKYDHPPDYYLGLNEAEYFQLSLAMDDLDEIIFMSDCIINGVTIMQIEILNNNPHNFRARINGGLDLHIHHTDGVVASHGIPNIEGLKRYVAAGIYTDVQRNIEEIERILRGVQDVTENVSVPKTKKPRKSTKK
ncbi:hypothetical protein AB9E46_16660 [Escherichia coli]|uniref:hypothetical protein n=1 Tax=Escherichia coli TaxID=562 RepID=UPI000750F0C7|nr:hypothetical protein [Escherichia coli]EFV5956363.1 hypothetical protein [Shigella sonnei]EFM3283786.1 hypothetical protein [Escherichia coli]EFV9501192.1 hypothetical protein [Shigella sonnei]KUS18347.1 hypothetical protein AWE62_04085 [Escherichia coli]HAH1116748.1 hypothetical protein [Escherichia coli]